MGKHEAPQPISWLTPRLRAWLYGILTALFPLIIAFGVLEASTAPLWLALGAAVLGTGTALVHTPRKDGK